MAKKLVLVSDLSGEEIPEGAGAKIAITTNGARFELDTKREEVENLISAGRKVGKRGRKPKTAA